jgi:hypothetical protein
MIVVWNNVRRMSLGLRHVTRRSEISQKLRDIVPHQSFLDINQFALDDSFRYQNLEIGVWLQKNTGGIQRRYIFMVPASPSRIVFFEFVSSFSDDVSLTTTASSSAFLFPRPPGSFLQSKKVNDIESLWSYHRAGEDFLIGEHGIETSQITIDFEQLVNKGLQTQGKYIRKIPFFWLRAPYWFYIHRFRMRGVSVKDQFFR